LRTIQNQPIRISFQLDPAHNSTLAYVDQDDLTVAPTRNVGGSAVFIVVQKGYSPLGTPLLDESTFPGRKSISSLTLRCETSTSDTESLLMLATTNVDPSSVTAKPAAIGDTCGPFPALCPSFIGGLLSIHEPLVEMAKTWTLSSFPPLT
jgi:hypothetical protein